MGNKMIQFKYSETAEMNSKGLALATVTVNCLVGLNLWPMLSEPASTFLGIALLVSPLTIILAIKFAAYFKAQHPRLARFCSLSMLVPVSTYGVWIVLAIARTLWR